MIKIIPCNDRYEELVQFVSRLNSDGTHHIGFFGEGEVDVRASLVECLIPPAEGFQLACEAEHLVGIFGVDEDLLACRVDWMLSVPTTQKINLTVNTDNVTARTLYEKFGFVTERIMRGYRKRVTAHAS